MAAYTERMERFENAIFKQREEINDRMAEMFRLLKELTNSRAPKKVLIRDEAKSLVTKNVNSISLTRGEEERNDDMYGYCKNYKKMAKTEQTRTRERIEYTRAWKFIAKNNYRFLTTVRDDKRVSEL
ncbi:hypothetical protein Tco_0415237 [Tanacetum coccineum]